MNSIIISGFGTSISVDKRKLIVQNCSSDLKLEFYPHQINYDSIVIDGHTGNISFEAIRWLMKHGINLTMLNWNGNLLSTTIPKEPKAGLLKVRQFEHYLDEGKRYSIALAFVKSKVQCSFNLLKELSNYYSEIDIEQVERSFNQEANSYFSKEENSISKGTINLLMNYEARIASIYWSILSKIFRVLSPEFNFRSRMNKTYSWNMNASDETNALLNYGYAILESEIRRDIYTLGFEPSLGFLHEIALSKTPLVYDFQELFRWLVDVSIIQLLEEKKITKSNFIVTENYHVRLRENVAKMLIKKINGNFNTKVSSYRNGAKNVSFQTILLREMEQLAKFVTKGTSQTFEFRIPDFEMSGRNDSLLIKDRILSMNPKERRALGINKSTLWYQKHNLAQGKRIKVYSKVVSKIVQKPAGSEYSD